MSRAALLAVTLGAGLVLLACRDITAPVQKSPASEATKLLNPAGTVLVTTDSLRGWAFYDDQQGVACGDTLACRLVPGPTGQPSGAGSAELATPLATDGKALVLGDYAGTRFDQFTELRYSTYRQTADPGSNLAIALQMNVDYDLDDQAGGYQGRLVFEPYQGIGGNVPDTTWQSWDARAGKWWGTRATVTTNGIARANPCVHATPCTWTALLATFPNVGAHQVYGAVILKAGSNWAGFRGNVDKLTIAVGGVSTTFDFELNAPASGGFRLRVIADAGVVFDHPISRDTVLPAGSTVPFAFSAAPGKGTLLTVLDDTLTAAAGTFVMDREHTLYAETEAPITPSAAVVDLGQRVRALNYSGAPQEALAEFMTWYSGQAAIVGRDILSAQLDTARFLYIDPVADAAALRAFHEAVNGTEFIYDGFGPGVWYMKPEWYGYEPEGGGAVAGSIASSGDQRRLRSSRRSASRSRQLTPNARSSSVVDDGEPDELTTIIYVNGVGATEYPSSVDASSATTTMDLLRRVVEQTPRFGIAGELRQNVSVTHIYNHSINQSIRDWEQAHHCEVTEVRESTIMGSIHSLLRFATCKGIPFVMKALQLDIAESVRQVIQLTQGSGYVAEDARKLAFDVRSRHESSEHTILVGHSQGNLMIAQALAVLPTITVNPKPLNVGNGCTAVLTLASPLARSSFPGMEAQYVHGMIVKGDILLQLGSPNDFARINTPAGDSLDIVNLLDRLTQGVHAHYVDQNYLRFEPSALKVGQELTTLSDECSAASFAVDPAILIMTVSDTAHLDVDVRSRTGRPLKGRTFNGRSWAAYVGPDSTVIAGGITTAAVEIDVPLDNTSKVKAQVSVRVNKRPMITTIEWTEEPMSWGFVANSGDNWGPPGTEPNPCGTIVSLTDPVRAFQAQCRFRYTISVRRADGKQLTFIDANPLDPRLGSPSREGGGSEAPSIAVTQKLTFEAATAAVTTFEVRVTDRQSPEGGPIAVDTVEASFAGKLPWPFASNSVGSSVNVALASVAPVTVDTSSEKSRWVSSPPPSPSRRRSAATPIPLGRPRDGGTR